MRRTLEFLSFIALLCCLPAAAQMSDKEIIAYVAEGVASGKSQSEIGAELLSKGVSASQMKRLLQNYRNPGNNSYDFEDVLKSGTYADDSGYDPRYRKMSEKLHQTDASDEDEGALPLSGMSRKDVADTLKKTDKEKGGKVIYGHNVFKNKRLSFEPNENAATPSGYILGPGDELIIDVWGLNEATIKEKVSPEGIISIAQVGQVQVSGLTIEQATGKIRNALSRKYALSGSNPASQMSVTLGNIRTIQVNVMGEVKAPGTYRLSSFSTVFNALYRAGGVTPDGSLRNVQVYRAGKLLGTSDIYKFLFDGVSAGNFSLSDGDVIIVPLYSSLVEVKGGVKRPMYYESIEGEDVGKILEYAGGFASNAYHDVLTIQRRDADKGKVFTVKESDYGTFAVGDGDIVTVYTNNRKEVFENRVEIKGMVVRPGIYATGGEIATVKQLVEHAGGLLDDAFTGRAQLLRENEDRSKYIKAIPIGLIMDGSTSDVLLQKNDVLIISNANDINVRGDLKINGYVMTPGDYEYAEGMTVEDLILLAGGLENGASSARVDVSRRIVDSSSMEASDTLAKIFSFRIADGLVVDDDQGFVLQPFDIVSVRKSPTYVEQKRVRVSGEVTFPGEYTLVSNNERLSDLYARAGMSTPNGFIAGAMLKRRISEDERNVRRNMTNLIKRGSSKIDSTKIEKMQLNDKYTIGINLDKAIANPGSEYDVVLHDGDELIIPSLTNTVRVQGEVMYPNAVNYVKGADVDYYIKQAGGFSNDAKKSKVYVVHMNGKVTVGRGAKVNPGCEVVVPAKAKDHKLNTGEWLAIGSTAASLATVLATLANIIATNTRK
ncbi:MAG: SLBB domain-containing protein [Bacteroidales bacterium]|nr:SLBB domain-containing protein [Bacteroidales bacterium]